MFGLGGEEDEGNTEAQFYNGQTWTDVLPEKPVEPKKKKNPLSFFRRRSSLSSKRKDKTPVAPVEDGNGNILVTIPSFRDGQRCGEALVSLFQNAKNPDNIMVSLVEQQNEADTYCVEAYCKTVANVEILERVDWQNRGKKVYSNEKEKLKCPRIEQIRVVRVQDSSARGPPWARAMGRRSLGNEEFCLQTSTHGTLVSNWDVLLREEWRLANNEFAVLSHPLQDSENKDRLVPRTCGINFLKDERLPYYNSEPEGMAKNLKKPLLAHTWSPGFSFSKCHLEEAAPSDGFLPYVSSNVEAFARYARMWTRGYDVYTPTKNVLFGPRTITDPHKTEWIDNWHDRKVLFLESSLKRIRSYLQIPELNVHDAPAEKLDNLGIYGIGKRRSLKQLNKFVGINLDTQQPRAAGASCGNFEWVPYDSEISPMENLFSNPDDLDPQPEFPMRTNLTFADDYMGSMMDYNEHLQQSSSPAGAAASPLDASRVPYSTLFVLWVVGLVVWSVVYLNSTQTPPGRKRRKKQMNKDK